MYNLHLQFQIKILRKYFLKNQALLYKKYFSSEMKVSYIWQKIFLNQRYFWIKNVYGKQQSAVFILQFNTWHKNSQVSLNFTKKTKNSIMKIRAVILSLVEIRTFYYPLIYIKLFQSNDTFID